MTDVYSSALSGMRSAKSELALNAHNVANADVENYTRLIINKSANIIGSHIGGVQIDGISTFVDQNLQDSIYDKISTHELHQTVKNYYTRIHQELGSPGDNNSISSAINNMFGSLERLASSPQSASLRLMAVQDSEYLANKIADLARSCESLRFEIDKQISQDIENLNVELSNAYRTNMAANSYPTGSLERVDAEERRRNSLEKIAEYLDVTKYSDNNSYKVFTADGTTIVGDSQYFLKYEPLVSVEDFVHDVPFSPILISYYQDDGNDSKFDRELVSGGTSSQVEHSLKGGKIAGLTKLRDLEIPKILSQLDELTKNLKESFNKIHNEGVGLNPPKELLGSTLISRDQYLGFTGNLKVSVVNSKGETEPDIPTVNIDLAKLDTGLGPGNANIQGIMREIDYHFGPKLSSQNKVDFANVVNDIKLAYTTKDIIPASPFTMDLDITNLSNTNATVSILGATAVDNMSANVLNSFSGASHTSTAGTTERTTNTGPYIDLTAPAIANYPITVTLDIRVNDGTTDYDATVTYLVNAGTPDSLNGHINNRVGATSVVGAATLVAPSVSSAILTTSIIDYNNQPLTVNSTETGTLAIRTNNQNYQIVIDDSDTNHVGVTGTTNIATNQKFSYYFGLNDFFVKGGNRAELGHTKNTAFYLNVRDDIKSDSSKLATSKFKQVVDYTNPANQTYEYKIYEGDNDNLLNLTNVANEKLLFASAGTLPTTKVSLTEYSAEIIGFNTSQLRVFNSISDETGLIRQSLKERIQNIKGVDVNEEMANMIIYQQNFSACARLIKTAEDMDKILLELLR